MRKNLSLLLAAVLMVGAAFAKDPNASQTNTGQRTLLKPGSYKEGILIVKMKPETRSLCQANAITVPSVSEKLIGIGAMETKKMFPRAQAPAQQRNSRGQALVDISLIYKISFDVNVKMEQALTLLNSDNAIEFAEPEYLNYMTFTPNDPSIGSQYHLNNGTGGVHAYNAWDVWQGDTNTVIGIIDSGTDWDHPDLINNIKYNYADPIGNGDEDGDGFTDNYRGWDVSENDNNPMVVGSSHGSHVSGCAAASTNNSTGVAAPAYKCKFLPVKASLDASSTAIDNGYDGIEYAAEHGCNVINLSWGRGGGPSSFEQTMINYAAINHDVTVVAAAGNNSSDETFYPASYENVVSVAGTNATDNKASFSNYNYTVDVCAPGNNIYATVYNNNYGNMTGTSMSSPIAAGCAAMIKSYFPSYTSEQVAMRLRTTADNIYSVPGNISYNNKLGKGRVNLHTALTDTTTPGIAMSLQLLSDYNDDVFLANDTMRIVIRFKNLLAPTSSSAQGTMTVASTNVQLIGGNTFMLGALNTFDTISNFAVPLMYKVKPTAPVNAVIPFKMTVTDGSYTDFFAFSVMVNVDYINIEINDISMSQTSKGRLGYNLPTTQGLGFKYQGSPSLLYEAGIMIGDGTHQVDDAVRAASGSDEDFAYNLRVTESPSALADFYSYGIMNENGPTNSGAPQMNVLVSHNTYAWNMTPDRKYVIVEYVITNMGSSTLSNVHAGIFADWDVPNVSATTDYNANVDSVDLGRRLGYVRNTSPDGYWAATKLLSNTAGFKHYAIDNTTGGNGGVNMFDGYNESEKFTTLSTNRDFAGGTSPTGNDVCDVTSTGPLTIPAGDSVRVAFALIGGLDFASIQASADAAQIKYDNLYLSTPDISPIGSNIPLTIYPNPIGKNTAISFSISENSTIELSIYSSLGKKVKTILNEKLSAGTYSYYPDLTNLAPGSYFICLSTGNQTEMQRMVIVE
jgi:serine protease